MEDCIEKQIEIAAPVGRVWRALGDRRAEAFRMNNGGWTHQMKSLEAYVCKTS